MNIEEFRTYCIQKPCVTEHFPFDEVTLVFKVCNKMFALSGLENQPPKINLKCDPERAIQLREEYDGIIIPGFHMSKKHWNTIDISNLPQKFIEKMIDDSYDLIIQRLPKKIREELL